MKQEQNTRRAGTEPAASSGSFADSASGRTAAMMSDRILEMRDITKVFPGVKALDGVNLSIRRGEIHALLGENGAGKSTLMNTLLLIYKKDGGSIEYEGRELKISSPTEALSKGIVMVPQELNLIPEASVAENVFLGNERYYKKIKTLITWRQTEKDAKAVLLKLGIDIDVRQPVKHLSASYQQLILIARALAYEPKVLILDEPTSALTANEADKLFEVMNALKAQGTSMILITHHLDEVMKVCDRMTIMRDGRTIHVCDKQDITVDEIIKYMANRDIRRRERKRREVSGEVFMECRGFSRDNEYSDISFSINKGEILCVAGLVGAGRTEFFKSVFGLTAPKPGAEIYIEGRRVRIASPIDAIRLGIGYVPEERRMMGIFPVLSVAENMMLPAYRQLTSKGKIDYKAVNAKTGEYIRSMSIKTPSGAAMIKNLSGGNQQKVIVARWMAKGVRMIILDEPTRGIDVNAKDEIHNLIVQLAESGVSVVVISSEMEEVLAIADRIMVMHNRELRGFIDDPFTATEEDVLAVALKGGNSNE